MNCGYCNQNIDRADGPHIHDPKKCRGCRQILPTSSFPIHPSAADGRRLDCKRCLTEVKAERKEHRAAQREEDRKLRNALFAEHGYKWVIKGPDGAIHTPEEAERLIDDAERTTDAPFDYF